MYNLRQRKPNHYIDGESDEDEYENYMPGHDPKRAKEDDESYDEDDPAGAKRQRELSASNNRGQERAPGIEGTGPMW